ncbi:hypothetical protein ACFVXG_05830 [Kitasatospora sp. NPDC058162]|uniref:hypothetical protein n=1 Tax=Kitasatospora sp. NPDC058162 TaxID=3346362 RepID=UPI0036DA93A8
MAETTAVSGGPEPTADSGPWDAVPPPPADRPAEEHPPGPAALYEPPPVPPVPPAAFAAVVPPAPPVAPTGWTLTGLPAAGAGAPAPAAVPSAAPAPVPAAAAAAGQGGLGATPRGRILVVEGGYGNSGRRTWGRGGAAQAPVLSAMLAAVSPQVLLAADGVDAVHLPGASDPHTVLAHLRAASRHPGPLLVHLGGHVVADKRGGQLQLTLRDAKQDGLPWQAIAAELSHRPAEWQTLVIADLSADQNAWPYLQGTVSPLSEGIPLWAVVSPDPEQIGTFTRALIEALHGGRPGAGEVLAPEQLRQQVYSVLRPDVVILATHTPDRPVFRNTARRGEAPVADVVLPVPEAPSLADAVPVSDAVPSELPLPTVPPLPPLAEPQDAVVERASAAVAPAPVTPVGGPVNLVKPGVPPTPPRAARPVSLRKAGEQPVEQPVEAPVEPSFEEPSSVSLRKATAVEADAAVSAEAVPAAGVTLRKARPEPVEAVEAVEAVLQATVEVAEDTDVTEVAEPAEEPRDAVPAEARTTEEAPQDAVPADAVPAEQAETPAANAPREDYREVIGRIVRSADAGDHAAATDLAFALELEAIAEHGAVSEPVLQVRQVRAHVCRLAGRPAEAAAIYREVAMTLLRSQGADHPETQRAATNAEACWRSIADRAEAIRIAPEIIELRAFLPGTDNRKLRAAERYLAQLAAAAPAVADQA